MPRCKRDSGSLGYESCIVLLAGEIAMAMLSAQEVRAAMARHLIEMSGIFPSRYKAKVSAKFEMPTWMTMNIRIPFSTISRVLSRMMEKNE